MWLTRNDKIFKGISCFTADVLKRADSLGIIFKRSWVNDTTSRDMRFVSWNPAGDFDFVAHVDGSSRGNPGNAGFGVVIRSGDGIWKSGYSGYIGVATSLEAELHGILHGLRQLRSFNISRSCCYSDSAEAVALANSNVCVDGPFSAIIRSIKDELLLFDVIHIRHILREGNFVADALARRGSSDLEFFTTWAYPPDDLRARILSDASGCCYPRF